MLPVNSNNMITDEKKNIPQGCPQGVQNHIIHIKTANLRDQLDHFHSQTSYKSWHTDEKNAVHSSENNRKDKPERQEAYHISEYVGKYCKCAKLLPVYPEPSDFHKGNQIIPVYPLRLCRPAIFLWKEQKIDKKDYIDDEQQDSHTAN